MEKVMEKTMEIQDKKQGKNKQTKQLALWIGALILGAILGALGIEVLNGMMNFVATVYTRLFQLLAVPTIALAVITTLSSLGNQADTGKIFRHRLYPAHYDSRSCRRTGALQHRGSWQSAYRHGAEWHIRTASKLGTNFLF